MFTLEYKNKYGTLTFGGGSHPVWNVTEITGLGLADKNITYVTFEGEDGRLTTDVTLKERTITMSGDVICYNPANEITRAMSILSHEGDIIVNENRLIHCNSVTFPDPKRYGNTANFTMQFICDEPYFGEIDPIVTSVLDIKNHIKDSFTLPMIFSSITTSGTIDVVGDSKTAPVINITNIDSKNTNPITISNESTGKTITLNYSPLSGETVEIDIDKRSVTGTVSGQILHHLSPDSHLSDFYLHYGQNKISLKNNPEGINITVKYRNKYASAMY